ncbi:MAG: carboxypeptidase-like regulatory domain-containing protein [Thermoguttaceae bacterium]|nr:carboxypeptidase-like regulatory domain-containing protein [Thermoguttaceae bacterium]
MKKLCLTMLLMGAVCMLGMTGCGEKLPPGMPKLYPAKMTVTYEDGKPIEKALIILIADGGTGNASWSHTGNTDASGGAEIFTQGKYKGLPAGKYKVTVSKTVSEGEPMPGEPTDEESAKRYDAWKKSANKEKVFKVISPEFEDGSKTPLSITVEAKGAQTFEVKAGKEVKLRQPDPWANH